MSLPDEFPSVHPATVSSSAELQDLYDNAPLGYLMLDSQGTILRANQLAHCLAPESPLICAPLGQFIAPASQDAWYFHWRAVLDSGTTQNAELQFHAGWFALTSALSVVEGKSQVRMLVVDIRERRRLEEGSRLSELVLGSVSQGVIVTGADQVIRTVNAAFLNMTGYTEDEVVGRNCRFLQDHRTDPKQIQAIRVALKNAAPFTGEISNTRKDGTLFWNDLSISPLKDPSGAVIQYVAITRDVTLRKIEAERRAALENQLRQSQKMESLGLLASGVAHDINNVLATIAAIASLPVESRLVHRSDSILKAVAHGRNLVVGLLNFSRKKVDESRPLNWNDIIREQLVLLEHTTLAQIDLRTEFEPNLPLMRGDPSAMGQILMNLAINGVDAMAGKPAPRTLTIRTSIHRIGLQIEVSDTGAGMAPEVLDKAIDPFFTTKPQGKGTGLGLSLVYGIVQAHRGQLSLKSVVGKGTTVTMRFPAMEGAEVPSLDGFPRSPVVATTGGSVPMLRRVLLVDDDDMVGESFRELLVALDCDPHVESRGEAALQVLETDQSFDVMLLDMNMPGLGGPATLRAARLLRPYLPVIVTTGLADQSVLDLIQELPGVSLLAKPFEWRDLKRVLDEVLSPATE